MTKGGARVSHIRVRDNKVEKFMCVAVTHVWFCSFLFIKYVIVRALLCDILSFFMLARHH